jgi:hypothetical protein
MFERVERTNQIERAVAKGRLHAAGSDVILQPGRGNNIHDRHPRARNQNSG